MNDVHKNLTNFKNRLKSGMLSKLGNQFELTFQVDQSCLKNIEHFKNDWKPYNPRKLNYRREGLSLTSLDGSLSGTPDLDSLREYNRINKKSFEESSFKKKTQVVKSMPSLEKVFDVFGESISRSHIIRFANGGFFPPHRDIYVATTAKETFRLFALLSFAHPSQYHFVLDGQLRFFMPGVLYYINTSLEHSFVSFSDDLMILVMNVDLNEKTIQTVQEHMVIK